MMNVDAPRIVLSNGPVVIQPDLAEITVEFSTDSPTAAPAQARHQQLHEELDSLVAGSGAVITPVVHTGERSKLLKKGVFGQGIRFTVRTQWVARLPLADAWTFWDRVERAEAVRTLLHGVSDRTSGLKISQIRWVVQDRSVGERLAYAALRESSLAQADALGADVSEIKPSACSVVIEGPTRAAFSATAEVVLRARAR